MTNGTRGPTTSASISAWTILQSPPRTISKSDTLGISTQDVVLISGRLVSSSQGINEVVISVEPSAVDRKLAIRNLNERLQGRTTKSNTFARSK